MMANSISRARVVLVVLALVATSCVYYPAASRSLTATGAQPWWCVGADTLTATQCLELSGAIDVNVAKAKAYPTVADALAAGAAPVDLGVDGVGVAYQLPNATTSFSPTAPQILLYAGAASNDRLAGVAHLVAGSVSTEPAGYPGNNDQWVSVGTDGSWLLPMWVVRGYENHPNVFASAHPCLAPGVTLTATTDPCFIASHPEPLDILVTNDDGIGAGGIDAVVEAIRQVPGVSVSVVAPATNQSGSSDTTTPGGVTSTAGATASGYPGVAVAGTPADSVLHALNVLGATPDLVVSGINSGQNMGPIVAASGTVGAARTAARNGVPAVATSQGGLGVDPDYPAGAAVTLAWLERFRLGLEDRAVPNINTPSCVDGTTLRGTIDTFVAASLVGRDYFTQDCASTLTSINDDMGAFNNGFASISDVGLFEPPLTNGSTNATFANADRCEVNGQDCLLPFPSDALTVADPTAPNGRRVALATDSVPANVNGVPLDIARVNRADGFSPGSAGLVLLPGIDPAASNLPPVTDIAASLLDASGTVVLNATTGERWAHWSELDANATDPNRQGLFVRPARNYPNGHRIIIAIRGAVDGDGNALAPTEAFRAYRDRLASNDPDVEARRLSMEQIFVDLAAAGVPRNDLVMAWDFTVISDDNLTAPLVSMRDDAFAALGGDAPTFTIDSVVDEAERRVINGTYEVPLYLTGDGSSGNGLNLVGGADTPTRNGTWTAPFRCQVSLLPGIVPGPGVIYGHGLLGSGRQTTSSGPTALSRESFVPCGTDLNGMAEGDVLNAVQILNGDQPFSTLADGLLQGHLNEIFLGRAMAHPNGFAADPAFSVGGVSMIDTSETYFYGISQGGIMGAVTTALSPDINRAVLGVPGVNYSTLLNRSIDFDLYQTFLDPAYPDKLDQAKVLLLFQMLWDRGEGNGYVAYFENPLPGMAPKTALLHVALGDHQVANVAADVMARSLNAGVVWPAVAPGRSTDVDPFWDIDRITSYPYVGSATVMWDSGSPLSPITNTSNHTGRDPHGDPRTEPAAVTQLAHFLRTGEVIDTCGGLPCTATP